YRVKEDGTELHKVVRTADPSKFSASPDGKWVVMIKDSTESALEAMLYPVGGGSPSLLCGACGYAGASGVERPRPPYANWSPDGKFFYLNFQGSIYAIPLRPGQMLPPIPTSGFRTKEDVTDLQG